MVVTVVFWWQNFETNLWRCWNIVLRDIFLLQEIIYHCVAVDFVLYLGPTRINLWTKVIHNATQCTNITHCREIIYYCVATVDFVLYYGPNRINFWTKVIPNATQCTNVDKIWLSIKAGFFQHDLHTIYKFFIVRHNYPHQITVHLRPILQLY